MTAQLSPMRGESSAGMEGWRLVRTPGPDKTEVVSVMRTADLMQSDAEFAGMMVRCRPKGGLQIAFAIITPARPKTTPKIALTANGSTIYFDGEVIPPGSLIALPHEAEVLAKDAWQFANEVRVYINGESGSINGVVSLKNLPGALFQLQAQCP